VTKPGPKPGQRAKPYYVNKRRRFIIQSCVDRMRELHPEEYNSIVREAMAVVPEGARPRYAEAEGTR
jgi:hypothetical protein